MELAPVDFNQLVTEVADLYRAGSNPVGGAARVRVVPDPTVGMVEVDRNRIRQILNNLLTNAREALDGRPDAVVTIQTPRTQMGGHAALELIVTDNGPGFDPEIVSQVFEPYVTSKLKGTGLGLAIVKKIVDEHGGRIAADNVTEGGARIAILLPLDQGARALLAAESREPKTSDLRRERA